MSYFCRTFPMLDFVGTWCSRINNTFFHRVGYGPTHGKNRKAAKYNEKNGIFHEWWKRGNKYARSMQELAADMYSIDSKKGKTPKFMDELKKP